MHPLLPAATARHRHELSTRQRVRLSLWTLATVAAVAAAGLFGSRLPLEAEVVRWFAARNIPLGFAGWVLYALPFCAFVFLMMVRPLALRLPAYVLLIAGLLAVAAMGRPRGMSATDWKAALGPGGADFVHATTWAAYSFLASAAVAAVFYAVRRPDHAGLRRLAGLAGLVSIVASFVAIVVV